MHQHQHTLKSSAQIDTSNPDWITQWPGYRWPHLFNLTTSFLQQSPWPQTDRWLTAEFRRYPAFGRRDRQFYRSAFFSLVREAAALVWLQAIYLNNEESLDWENWWPNFQAMPVAEVWAWLLLLHDLPEQAPKDVLDVVQRQQWLCQLDTTSQHKLEQLRLGWLPPYQPWLDTRQQQSGWTEPQRHQWQALQSQRAPLWIRVQPQHMAEVSTELVANGFTILQKEPSALAIIAESHITTLSSWQHGFFDIQDRASQRIVEAMDVQENERICDVCAGAGGKSLAIASAVGPNGYVLATDNRAQALVELQTRAKRLGVKVETLRLDATQAEQLAELAALNFDAVLVDAPCSGSGTWRRRPDERWRLNQTELANYCQLQALLLQQAACIVPVGARLVYATCSWLVAENEQIVQQFLAHHVNFHLQKSTLVGAPLDDADTMFVAVMYHTQSVLLS